LGDFAAGLKQIKDGGRRQSSVVSFQERRREKISDWRFEILGG
jgi:hypothetical protein